MILNYIDSQNKSHTKVEVIKFWVGKSHIKFQFKNKQVIEVPICDCFLYDPKEVEKIE